MAPFPETEIMTIKRLEVALRRMDFKLLKDGAYKLHEKFHSGHKFEYIDLLEEISLEVGRNDSIPNDIKGVLIPTIEDILHSTAPQESDSQEYTDVENNDSQVQERISSLTSIPYKPTEEEAKIDAFEAFSTHKEQQDQDTGVQLKMKTVVQSPFSAEPFKEFSAPQFVSTAANNAPPVQVQEVQQEEPPQQQAVSVAAPAVYPQQAVIEQPKQALKTAAIYYGQDFSSAKMKNIAKFRELILRLKEDNIPLGQLFELNSEINSQANVDVIELKPFIDRMKTKESPFNLITNSQSSALLDLMIQSDTSYTLYSLQENKKINLIPLFGMTNLFKCTQCGWEYLNFSKEPTPLVLECTKCKQPMVCDCYSAQNNNSQIHLDYYNASIVAFASCDNWLLIHPSIDDNLVLNLMKSALSINPSPSNVFILDKDINAKEACKRHFLSINPNIRVNTQTSAADDFFNSIR